MLASEIRDMTDGDIRSRINELEEERFRLKFRGATQPLEEPLRLRSIRRDVARLKTVQRERELAAAAEGKAQGAGAAVAAAGTRTKARRKTRKQER